MSKGPITHEKVQAATAKFLASGGKIQTIDVSEAERRISAMPEPAQGGTHSYQAMLSAARRFEKEWKVSPGSLKASSRLDGVFHLDKILWGTPTVQMANRISGSFK